jgi:hypothetical protein
MKRIMTRKAYEEGKVQKNKQDGNREFISCLACISAIGKAIPAALIYEGASGDLQDTWVKEVKPNDPVYFGSSASGWSSNRFGMEWLEKVFERHTKPSNPRTKRLLIVDGHSSHVNMEFIDWADRHGIIILILPPHTTHKLQPLDVGLFQPLSTAYSQEQDKLMVSSGGLVSMTKRLFYPMFLRAFQASFTEDNIIHTWAKTGIWPLDRTIVLARINQVCYLPQITSSPLKTPSDTRTFRQFKLQYRKSPTAVKISKLLRAVELMTTQNDILRFENRGLREAIVLEKSKRRRGKKLNLVGEESKGVELYSPAKVARAREYQAEKESLEEQENRAKEARKVQRAANALKSKEIKDEKAAARQLEAELKAQARVEEAALKASTLQQRQAASRAKKAALAIPKPSKKVKNLVESMQALRVDELNAPATRNVNADPMRVNSRGRAIQTPKRFKD